MGHLFFGCFVAKRTWEVIAAVFGVPICADFESVARWWISNDRNAVLNIFSSAVLWSIWCLRNELCFQGKTWMGMHMIWDKVIAHLGRW